MENIFLFAGIISIIFFIIKFVEMRFVEKESKPLKYLIRDSLLTYFSVVIGYFIIEQIKPLTEEIITNKQTVVFTDNPNF
jgi:hypothetical protein